MIVIDTSVVIAVLGAEPGFEAFEQAMASAAELRISAPLVLEATQVASRWHDRAAIGAVDAMLAAFEVEIAELTLAQLSLARTAFLEFGKGRGHPANLNQMDCFSYALAKSLDAPLLFKGEDFLHTDVRRFQT